MLLIFLELVDKLLTTRFVGYILTVQTVPTDLSGSIGHDSIITINRLTHIDKTSGQ